MGLAGAYRQPLEARFRTTARAGSGLTSLHVAGRRPVGLWGAPCPFYAARYAVPRFSRRLTRVTSLYSASRDVSLLQDQFRAPNLPLGPVESSLRKPAAAWTRPARTTSSRGERGRQPAGRHAIGTKNKPQYTYTLSLSSDSAEEERHRAQRRRSDRPSGRQPPPEASGGAGRPSFRRKGLDGPETARGRRASAL